jgi:aryl-alcohol dehydrogenase-like predicted oxidoreductase
MIHNSDDLIAPGGDLLYDKMVELKNRGLLKKIGVSVYTADQIDSLLSRFSPDIIQLPVNLLDQQLIQSGHLEKLKDTGIEIHARSIFLQGVLLMKPEDLPPHFDSAKPILDRFQSDCGTAGISQLQAAIDFVLNIEQVDYAIIGVCNTDHLTEIIEAVSRLSGGLSDYSRYALNNDSITNPSKWRVEVNEQEISR